MDLFQAMEEGGDKAPEIVPKVLDRKGRVVLGMDRDVGKGQELGPVVCGADPDFPVRSQAREGVDAGESGERLRDSSVMLEDGIEEVPDLDGEVAFPGKVGRGVLVGHGEGVAGVACQRVGCQLLCL